MPPADLKSFRARPRFLRRATNAAGLLAGAAFVVFAIGVAVAMVFSLIHS